MLERIDGETHRIIQPIQIDETKTPAPKIIMDQDANGVPRNLIYDKNKRFLVVYEEPAFCVRYINIHSTDPYGLVYERDYEYLGMYIAPKTLPTIKKVMPGAVELSSHIIRLPGVHKEDSEVYIIPPLFKNNTGKTLYIVSTFLAFSNLVDYPSICSWTNLETVSDIKYYGDTDRRGRLTSSTCIYKGKQYTVYQGTIKFTCDPGKAFTVSGVSILNPSSTWYGNNLIGISVVP
jgi:hypothetical protein